MNLADYLLLGISSLFVNIDPLALLICIVAVCAASFLFLRLSAHGAKWLSPLAMHVVL